MVRWLLEPLHKIPSSALGFPWLKIRPCTPAYVCLATVFDSFSLSELVCTPTRDNNLLDVLVSSRPWVFCDVRVTDAGLVSDHRLVTARLECRRMKVKTSYSSRNIREIDIAGFDRAMRASSLFTAADAPADTTDGFADQLQDVVMTLLDKFAPLRAGLRHWPKSSSRWMSREAVTAKRDRRRLERCWLATGAEEDRQRYRRACCSANLLINESRSDHYRTRLEDCANDPGKWWRVVKELLHTSDCDNTSTNAENRDLCFTFSDFLGSKISTLKSSVAARLSGFHPSAKFSDSI